MNDTAILSLAAEIFTSVSETAMVAVYMANPGEFKFELSVKYAVDSTQAVHPPDLLSILSGKELEFFGANVNFLSLKPLEQFGSSLKNFMQDAQFESVICIPMTLANPFRENAVGLLGIILAFSSRRQDEFVLSSEQADRLNSLATLTSLALSQSWAVEKLERTWIMAERQQKLLSLAEIAAGVAHDASNTLNALSASCLLLEKEIDRNLAGRSNARLQGIFNSVEQNLQKLSVLSATKDVCSAIRAIK